MNMDSKDDKMSNSQTVELKYNEDGIFRIVQFTDTHVGNMPFHEDDYKTFALIEKVLTEVDVDLVIHTGDIIWSDGVKDADIVFAKTLGVFEEHSKAPMVVTFGNHDSEELITRADLRNIYEDTISLKPEKKHTFIVEDYESFVLEIKGSDDSVKNVVYVIDSGDDAPLPIGLYDWVKPEQVNWFNEVSKEYKKGDQVKRNLVFQHIPVPEYWDAIDNIIDGVNYETNEQISAPHINTGLFANMLINQETWGIFVGHDHDNNFNAVVHGIHLVYGNVSGYQTYGDLDRGVRIIELNEKTQEVKTYTMTV